MSDNLTDRSPYFIKKYGLLDSTNLFALREFGSLPDGAVITAEKQTAGRGRMSRSWLSEGKGLYFTVVLKKARKAEYYAAFSHLMSVSICMALEKEGLAPQIKWPNDVLCAPPAGINMKIDAGHAQEMEKTEPETEINSFPGKICGILSQAYAGPHGLEGIVLGAGINCLQAAEDFTGLMYPAYSMKMLSGHEPDKEQLLKTVLDFFFARKPDFEQLGFPSIKNEYCSRCAFIGKEIKISVSIGSNIVKETVFAEKINSDGTLSVIRKGRRETISAADILQ